MARASYASPPCQYYAGAIQEKKIATFGHGPERYELILFFDGPVDPVMLLGLPHKGRKSTQKPTSTAGAGLRIH
jgi:hypothetical protein